MIQQTIDLFRKEQTMSRPNFEIYNYADTVPPKVFPHVHDFYEIYYILSDTLTYMVKDREYLLQRGDFLMIPPGILHYPSDLNIRQGTKYARIVLWISTDFFDSVTRGDTLIRQMWDTVKETNSYHIRPTQAESAKLLDALGRLLSEQRSKNISTGLMSYALIAEILVNINRSIHTMAHFEKHTQTSSLFSNLINYIHEHLGDDLSIDTLSKEFFISKSYISKLFREYMNVSVHQYILMLRLDGCRKAMEEGIPVTECIESYGFKDYSSFYRAFKGAFLQSPSEYQKAFRK